MHPSHADARYPRRIVIKVGTALLTSGSTGINASRIEEYAESISRLCEIGTHVALVSSGAISAGVAALRLRERPQSIPEKQATAAVGQPLLMAAYERAFRNRGRTIGQVLLTRDDFAVRTRYLNARRTFSTLFSHGVVPVINENDTVAIDEIRLGDNDNLSAFVAQLVGAELLILLSDVDGLYSDDPSRNPHATLIPIVEKVTPAIERLARQSGSDKGTGGMITKLQAARTCSTAGIAMIIANGSRPHVLEEIVSGTFRGTLFLPAHSRLNVRKHWIGFVAHTRGEIVIDDGAVSAILHRHSSLLPGGITGVTGIFQRGDTVSLQNAEGREIARGIVSLSSQELTKVKGMNTTAMRAILGTERPVEIIHKDNLAILEMDL